MIDKGYAFKVTQQSGNIYDVSWDTVHYFCNPAYEYYYKKKPSKPLTPLTTIGHRITKARQSRSITVTDLAARAGLKRPNLSRIEHGKVTPSLPTLECIASALQIPLVELLTD